MLTEIGWTSVSASLWAIDAWPSLIFLLPGINP